MLFQDLNLIEPILKRSKTEGYTQPTLQYKANPISIVLQRKELIGLCANGYGQNGSIAIPVLQLLTEDFILGKKQKKSIDFDPNRVGHQIMESFAAYGTGIFH